MNWKFRHIAAQGTVPVTEGRAALMTVNVNTGATSAVLTIYNGTAIAANKVAVIDASTASSKGFGVQCEAGILAVLAGGDADVTIGYR